VAGKFEKHDDHFENDRYVVTSAVGHLVEIQAPEEFDVKRGKWSFAHLPVIPPYFDLKPVDKTKTRLNAVVKQAKRKDVTELINACDAGREGELIFRLIEQYAGGSKPLGKPVKRLWLQSMTPQAIRDGFDALRTEQQMAGLAHAARSRSEADWLVGINGTRAMTAFNSRDGGFFLTTVGRVQTPTLSLVVEREEKIRKFISRDYWEIHATFGAQAGEYPAKWFDPKWKKGEDAEAKRRPRVVCRRSQAIANAVRGKQATVTEESKPTTQASPLLFDLTSLQREANGKFGFSAKTTLALAQSLYERHKALTYPRTDSRALPEDYLPVAKQTFEMLADSGMRHLAPHALTALNNNYVRPSKRIFDNSKVSDHFAIIPTLQAPSGLSEAEQKLYDLVVRRFMAVFFPSAEYTVTTRISTVAPHSFKTEGKVLVKPGWLAIYGKEAADEVEGGKDGDKGQNLVPVKPGEMVNTLAGRPQGPQDQAARPLLRSHAAGRHGKRGQADRRRRAARSHAGKRPGHARHARGHHRRPADRKVHAARRPRDHPHGQGLPAHDAAARAGGGRAVPRRPDRRVGIQALADGKGPAQPRSLHAGDCRHDRAHGEEGQGIRPRHHPRRLRHARIALPQLRRRGEGKLPPLCLRGQGRRSEGCGFSFGKSPAGRTFETAEANALLRDKKIGPLEGFRSKAGWPFTSEIVIKYDDEAHNYKLEFDFGDDKKGEESGEIVEFEDASLGACPICGSDVHEHGSNYVCSKAVPTAAQPTPSCTFKSGKIILQQPVEREQMTKLLETGKTDLLDKFVSMRTRRAFKAHLAWDKEAGKVNFEFAPSKFPPRPGAAAKTDSC
jgi:DNA topoisomerase-3